MSLPMTFFVGPYSLRLALDARLSPLFYPWQWYVSLADLSAGMASSELRPVCVVVLHLEILRTPVQLEPMEVVEYLRSGKTEARTPIVVITTRPELTAKLYAAGVSNVLLLPNEQALTSGLLQDVTYFWNEVAKTPAPVTR